jgi:signal transduction histidine kinase/CheY-like chemotaxis protein
LFLVEVRTRLRSLSMRGYLLLLVFSVAIPGALFAAILLQRYYNSEVARINQDLLNNAHQLAQTVDRDLAGLQATLQTLALSRAVAVGDHEAFYRQATQVRDYVGAHVMLRDAAGRHLVNTRVPFGTPLPSEELPGDREVREHRKPVVSGVVIGSAAGEPVYNITAAVLQDGQLTRLLSLSLPPERLAELLKQGLDPGHIAGIFDRDGLFLARSERQGDFVGRRGPETFLSQMRGNEGNFGATNVTGDSVSVAYARSNLSGWAVVTSVPDKASRASLHRALWTLGVLAVLLTLLAILLAYAIGNRLAGAVQNLASQAASLGQGEPVVARQLPVREVNAVGQVLAAASENLRQRERERDDAERELRALSGTLENRVFERTRELAAEMKRRSETEEALRQARKMEAIGQLTGGIAHDFNNMLAIIIGSLDLAARRLAKGDVRIEKYLASAQEGGRRAAALIQQLLAFSRQQPLAPAELDANKLVSAMSELLRRSLGETIRLATVLADELWKAHADRNQLENAVLNLALNARDAMPEGGQLTVETRNAVLDDPFASRSGLLPGEYVLITIRDTGTGMAPEVIEKAFDPFFTTKQSGAGTGLGLSQVYGFVRQSGGHVAIESEVGKGTAVKIYLPRYRGEAVAKVAEDESSPMPTGDASVTVLVVEDEDGVRAHAVAALRELGYSVLDAAGAADAIKIVDAHPEIGLLFTDVVMPEMNGRRLSDAVRARRSDIKVLFTTGYTRDAIVHNGTVEHGVSLITKPFTLDQLARKVAEVLRA